jgi:hypothetical protein
LGVNDLGIDDFGLKGARRLLVRRIDAAPARGPSGNPDGISLGFAGT